MDVVNEKNSGLVQIIQNKDWDSIDYETVFQELKELDCTEEEKNEYYEILHIQLRKKERDVFHAWLLGRMYSWPWILVGFPVVVALITWVTSRFSPLFLFAGVFLICMVTVDRIKDKIVGKKAQARMDHLKEIGFDLTLKEIPTFREIEEQMAERNSDIREGEEQMAERNSDIREGEEQVAERNSGIS